MNPHQPRILIVDDQRHAARSLRAALEQACPGCAVTLVPSGEEALLELRQPFDLLIVNELLPGMPGAELLARTRHVCPGLPAVVITDGSLDDAVSAMQQVEVLWFFQRPADADAMAEAISRLLTMEQGQASAPPAVQPAPAPVRPTPDTAIMGLLAVLRSDLGADAVALIGASGEALLVDQASTLPDLDAVAAVLAEHCLSTSALAGPLGGQAQSVHYYEGPAADIYALTTGPDALIAIFFPGGSTRQIGAVLLHGRRAARRVGTLLAPASVEPALPHSEPLAEAVEAGELAAPSEDRLAWDPGDDADEIDLDLDELAYDLANGAGDNLDAYWEEAASLHTRVSDDALSLDEAMELGLFDDGETS